MPVIPYLHEPYLNEKAPRRLFEGGACSSNYLSNCNWQLESLLHFGQIVITFKTLLHLGPFITFRPSTNSLMVYFFRAEKTFST